MRPVEEQLEYLLRGIDRVVPEEELRARLAEDKPLRVKLGVDPTAPDVHLGWAVVFDLLRRFQEMGHVAVLIIGDFTAQVGDPSGSSDTRARLSAEDVAGYAASCLEMLRPLLLSENLEVRHNSEWLSKMDMHQLLELTQRVTVSRIIEREDFASRLAEGRPVSMIELLYPLLQGMDSVAIDADIEIGGADQLWNLLVGRELQGRYGKRPQLAMTVPLLVGTDGIRKMSQSLGNYISVRDPADEMFGKVMSIPDDVMPMYYVLAAGATADEAEDIRAATTAGTMHPGEAKRELGRRVVTRYWDEAAAREAEAAFDRVFRDKEAPEEVPEASLPDGDPVWIPGALKEAGLVASTSEGKRMVAQGAVRIDGAVVEAEEVPRAEIAGHVVQVGKRRFARLVS